MDELKSPLRLVPCAAEPGGEIRVTIREEDPLFVEGLSACGHLLSERANLREVDRVPGFLEP